LETLLRVHSSFYYPLVCCGHWTQHEKTYFVVACVSMLIGDPNIFGKTLDSFPSVATHNLLHEMQKTPNAK
jgi:hypothetical protein